MNRLLVMVPAAALALAACTRPPDNAAAAKRCDAPDAGNEVYVDVAYDGDGMPSVAPDPCVVVRGTQVEWRGPERSAQAFEIRFKNANPAPSAPRGHVPSKGQGSRQAAWARIDAAPGRYDYGIKAGSKERDPAIIIR